MPREMFGEVSAPSVKLGSQAWYTVPLSIAAHGALCAIVLIVPLVAADVLPAPPLVIAFVAPPQLPAAPPPPAAAARRTAAPAPHPDAAPVTAPENIQEEHPPIASGVPTEGGIDLPHVGAAVPGPGLNLPVESGAAPPSPPASTPPQLVRPGGNIKVPAKIHHVPPAYPVLAQQARMEGTVILEATIGVDGRVKDARVLRSRPLLDQAAVDAVMQWRFTPTLLNGVPVPILMTVTVTFNLAR